MRNAKYLIGDKDLLPADNLQGIVILLAKNFGLTCEQACEPETFPFGDRGLAMPINATVRVLGTDGGGWATVMGKTQLGNVVLQLDRPRVTAAVPAPKRVPAVSA